MKNNKAIIVLDRILEACLWGIVFFLAFSKAGLEIWFHLGLFVWLIKRSLIAREMYQSSRKRNESLLGFRFTPSPINLPIYIFAIICFVSVLFSVDIPLAFEGIFGKLYTYLFVFFLTLEVITRYNPAKDTEAVVASRVLNRVLGLFLFSIFIISFDGFWQFFTGKDFMRGYAIVMQKELPRLRASFRSPNDFATWIVVILPILFTFIFVDLKVLKARYRIFAKIGFILLSVAGLFLLARTFSRGAWLGFVTSVLFMSIFGFIGSSRRLKRFSALGAGIIFVSLAVILMIPPLQQRVVSLKQGFGKAGHRRRNWKEAVAIIKDYPFLGTGPNTYTKVGPKYKLRKRGGIYPHNSYLHLTAEVGLFGFLAFVWIFWRFFFAGIRRLRRHREIVLLGILGGSAALLVQSFFDTTLYSMELSMLLWFIVGLGISYTKRGNAP